MQKVVKKKVMGTVGTCQPRMRNPANFLLAGTFSHSRVSTREKGEPLASLARNSSSAACFRAGHALHPAVGQIADPACDIHGQGGLLGPSPEPDALDAARDEAMDGLHGKAVPLGGYEKRRGENRFAPGGRKPPAPGWFPYLKTTSPRRLFGTGNVVPVHLFLVEIKFSAAVGQRIYGARAFP